MIILSLLERDPAALRRAVLAAPRQVGAVEVRLDALRRPTEATLRGLFEGAPRPIIAACRRRRDGGLYSGSEPARLRLLQAAVRAGAAQVDLESDRAAGTAAAWPGPAAPALIVSHHRLSGLPGKLDVLVRRLRRAPGAGAVKVVWTARGPADLLAARALLRRHAGRTPPLICFCMGEAGRATRVLAESWGSRATYASAAGLGPSAPGQIPLDELLARYRIGEIDDETRLTGLIGSPIRHSLSPAIHNAACAAQGLNYRYLPLEIPRPSGLRDLRRLLRELPLRGLSVTAPYKVAVLRHLDAVEPAAGRIGAVNTILWDGRRAVGFNTDATGGFAALSRELRRLELPERGLSVAVLGSGGSAMAIAHAAAAAGHRVVIASRSPRPARRLARAVGGLAILPRQLGRLGYDVLVNCTPVGMDGRRLPLAESAIRGKLVFDLIYSPQVTPLLAAARRRSIPTLGGLEMLLGQAAEQHTLFTGRSAPEEAMRAAAIEALSASG